MSTHNMFLMSTRNICFHRERRKNIDTFLVEKGAISVAMK